MKRHLPGVLRRLIPILISAILLLIIVRLAPWDQVASVLSDLDLVSLALLLALSLIYYALKIWRFWLMLNALDVRQPFRSVALTYLAAQPVSLLPGGELYRSKTLEDYKGVHMHRSVPTFTAQGLFEGLGLSVVGLVAAMSLGIERVLAAIVLLVVIIAVAGIRAGWLVTGGKILNRVSFIHLNRQRLGRFSQRNQALLSGKTFWQLSAVSLVTELVGSLIAYVSVAAIGGQITLAQSALVYVAPIVIGFVSFLPGGLGASEQGSIGLLLLFHQGGAIAVAATLIMRVAIVGLGVLIGLAAWVVLQLRLRTRMA